MSLGCEEGIGLAMKVAGLYLEAGWFLPAVMVAKAGLCGFSGI